MEQKLSMSLDEIIERGNKGKRGKSKSSNGKSSSGPVRSRQSTKNIRNTSQPYSGGSRRRSEISESDDGLSIKFLVSHAAAGILIGTGGQTIKKFNEVTKCKITVSTIRNPFPGTSSRVVHLVGTEKALDLGLKMLFEVVALEAQIEDITDKNVLWSPRRSMNRAFDGVEIEAQLTVPAAAAGALIGRGGSTLKAMCEASGAQARMSGKDEHPETEERVIVVAGTVESCVGLATQVLAKLADEEETPQFTFAGGSYSSERSERSGGATGGGSVSGGRGSGGRQGSDSKLVQPTGFHMVGSGKAAGARASFGAGGAFGDFSGSIGAVISASSTLELAVDDSLVGAVVGVKGAKVKEVMSVTGATITISQKGEYVSGTTNRLVTITGTPAAAQSACVMLSHLIQQASEEG